VARRIVRAAPSAEDVALARMDRATRREVEAEVEAKVDAMEQILGASRVEGAKRVPKSEGSAKRRARVARRPADRLAVLGLFGGEAINLAVTAITKTVERGAQAESPGEGAERNYLMAAKTVLEYELGKPRQQVQVSGPEGDPLKVVFNIPRPEGPGE
jgi:hypothetical protein